jgi:hypothetical protein
MAEDKKSSIETAGRTQDRRFKSCVIFFLIASAVIVGVPVTIGLVGYYRARADADFAEIFKRYNRAQTAYHSRDRDGDKKKEYARKISLLVGIEKQDAKGNEKGESGEEKPLVSPELAAARGADGKPFRGYLFLEMRTIWKIPINWEGDFAICATPARYGESGKRTWIMKTDGDIWWKDLGKAEFLKDYPQDLEEAGWTRFGEKQKDE